MPARKRVAITISLPPDIAKEYAALAKGRGETKSQLFRKMFTLYRQGELENEFCSIRKYGAKKASEMNLTEKDVGLLVFESR